MLEYQRLVDEIQSAVYSLGTADRDLLRDVAAQYAEACEVANQRLRSCRQLLKQGLRGEAIQLAEQEPNLLDLVSMLDFPELPQWYQILQSWQMAVPPQLRIDVASELNEAYAAQQPLQVLLRNHRLLALGRAPLASRLTVLRRIQQADPMNPAWQDDLRDWEKVRLKQVSTEAERAVTGKDGTTLAALINEVESTAWIVPPANDMVQRIRSAYEDVAARDALRELETIEQGLTRAYSEFDVETGQRLRQQWQELSLIAGMVLDHPLYQRVLPALEWLDEQDERGLEREAWERAVKQLSQGLDDEESREKLEKLYHAAIRFDEPLPAQLENRLRSRLDSFDLSARRKQRLILLGVVSAVLLAGSGIAALIFIQQHHQNVTAAADALHNLTKEERFSEATTFFDNLQASNPSVAASAPVQQRKGELDGAKQDEQQRANAFRESLAAAESAGVDTPNRSALEKARELAKTEEEKALVSKLEVAIVTARRETQLERDMAFAADLSAVRDRLVTLEESDIDEDAQKTIETLLEDLRLLSRRSLVSEEVKQPIVALRTRILAIQDGMENRRRRARAVNATTQSVGNIPNYVMSLDSFQVAFPEAPETQDFKQAKEEQQLWGGMLAWSKMLRPVDFSRLRTFTSEEAQALLTQGRELLEAHSSNPLADYFRAREEYLESIVYRAGENGQKLKSSLLKLLQDPLVNNVYVIQTKEGRYYCLEEPDLDQTGTVNILYVTDFTLETRGKLLRRDDILSHGLAGQSKVASAMSVKLKAMTDADWETTFYSLVQILRSDTEMDPILKMLFLKRTLETATTISPVLAIAFSEDQRILSETDVDTTAKWILPDDSNVDQVRTAAAEVLKELPMLSEATATAREEFQKLTQGPPADYAWIGWLGRGNTGDWKCNLNTRYSAEKSGDLMVICESSELGKIELCSVGKLTAGKAIIDTDEVTRLLAGRPVFLLESEDEVPKKQSRSDTSEGAN